MFRSHLSTMRGLASAAMIAALPLPALAAEGGPMLVLFHCDGGEVTELIAFEVTPDETVIAVTHPDAQLVETPRTVTLVEPDGRVIHIEGEDSFMSQGGKVHALACRDATGQLGPVAARLAEMEIDSAEVEISRLRDSHAVALARIAELEEAARAREHHEGW